MRTSTPRVVRYLGSETSKFVVEGLRVNGKRTRKFFKTRREGQTWLRVTLARMRKEGEGAVHMPEQLRVEAVVCAEKLKPYGKTITDATEHYLAYLATLSRSCTVSELVAELLKAKEQDGASVRYLQDLKHRLEAFAATFGDRTVGELTAAQADDWLRGLDVAALTRNNFRRILGVFFSFAVSRGYAVENVIDRVSKAKAVRGAPGIFTPEQMAALLKHAPAGFIPFVAIGGFAGLRTAEIERLDWSEVDLANRLIHVKPEKAKSSQRRLVTISENLWAWLAPHAKKAGPVVDMEQERKWKEKTCKAAELEWPHNALRHSFASYHLAEHKQAGSTALELGHQSPAMLFNHYRELVRPDAAKKWWAILPPKGYADVLPFAAGA